MVTMMSDYFRALEDKTKVSRRRRNNGWRK